MQENVPQQTNGSDCGVSVCLNMLQLSYADPLADLATEEFTYQYDWKGEFSSLARQRIFVEIYGGTLLRPDIRTDPVDT